MLKQNLYRQWIVFHDLNPTNILVKRLGFDEFRLVVIDGIGHNHFLPLASFSCAYVRKKLVRVWNRRYRQWYGAFPLVVAGLIITRLQTAGLRISRRGLCRVSI